MSEKLDLKAQFAAAYKKACATDLELFRTARKQTADYWDLGCIAEPLKVEVGHGNWLKFLEEQGYVERTVQRALKVYDNFRDDKAACCHLTLAEATGESVNSPLSKDVDKAASEAAERAKNLARARHHNAVAKYVADKAKEREEEENELAAAGEVPPEEKQPQLLLTESVEGSVSLKDAAPASPEGGAPEETEAEWIDLWNYIDWMIRDEIETLTDEESKSVDGCIAAIGNRERALQVLLIRSRQLLKEAI